MTPIEMQIFKKHLLENLEKKLQILRDYFPSASHKQRERFLEADFCKIDEEMLRDAQPASAARQNASAAIH